MAALRLYHYETRILGKRRNKEMHVSLDLENNLSSVKRGFNLPPIQTSIALITSQRIATRVVHYSFTVLARTETFCSISSYSEFNSNEVV